MAKQRIVNTRFWDDSYISGLSPTEKLLFLYLLTNPVTNIAGVYELPLRRAAFDTGIPEETVQQVFHKFSTDGKILRQENWIGIKNFLRYQTLNPKVKQGVLIELRKAPKELVDRLSIDLQTLSNSNPNPNTNLNPNSKSNRYSTLKNQKMQSVGEVLQTCYPKELF